MKRISPHFDPELKCATHVFNMADVKRLKSFTQIQKLSKNWHKSWALRIISSSKGGYAKLKLESTGIQRAQRDRLLRHAEDCHLTLLRWVEKDDLDTTQPPTWLLFYYFLCQIMFLSNFQKSLRQKTVKMHLSNGWKSRI